MLIQEPFTSAILDNENYAWWNAFEVDGANFGVMA
jgi:hypothetical protein